jgi:imidazolonepropionase-like amidohydrolase
MVDGYAEPYGIPQERIEQARYPEELAAQVEGMKELHARGVRFVAGGDFGHQWTQHGTYAAELVAYVELAGMTPAEALRTATTNAGPLVDEKLGKVEPGYLADLVILDGDPTQDVSILLGQDRIKAVFKAGEAAAGSLP